MNTVETIYSRNHLRQRIPYQRTREPLSLLANLEKNKTRGKTGVISEFKRKSPSGFEFSKNLGPLQYFKGTTDERVAGLSILTEPEYFLGSYGDITEVQELGLPILDKDFASNKAMVENAYNSGADAILFILDFIKPEKVGELASHAVSLGMEALVEFHDLSLIKQLQPREGVIYGYNRRNLRTLKMEPQEDKVLLELDGSGVEVLLESGINRDYLERNDVSPFLGMLIGTSILQGNLTGTTHTQ